MDKIAKNISAVLESNNVIRNEDTAICAYGLELFFTTVLEIGVVLTISAIIGNFLETLVFLVTFISIRIFSGGYHADSRLKCFLILLGVYAAFSIIILFEDITVYKTVMPIIIPVTLLCVYILSPLKHRNKTLSDKERIKFHHISVFFTILESSICVLIIMFDIYNKYSTALFLGLVMVLISLIAGKIKELLTERRIGL